MCIDCYLYYFHNCILCQWLLQYGALCSCRLLCHSLYIRRHVMCIGEEGALQEQNLRLLLYVVNKMSIIAVSFLLFSCSCYLIHMS
jgi:hypothetical protein